jgi:adenine phosphoribosyltransferase
MSNLERIQAAIRSIPDYPKPGILFRDITTLLGDGPAFAASVAEVCAPFAQQSVDKVVGLEARGFILGGAVALALGAGFVPVRKRGKLPCETHRIAYELEYGRDELEVHTDAISPGQSVVVVDDLIATGGTALAAIALLRRLNAQILGAAFVIDLPDLGGALRLASQGIRVHSLVSFPGH